MDNPLVQYEMTKILNEEIEKGHYTTQLDINRFEFVLKYLRRTVNVKELEQAYRKFLILR